MDIYNEKEYAVIISQRLRQARRQAGLTQIRAAKAAGLSQSALSEIESAKRTVSLVCAIQLAKAYDIQLSELLGEQAPDREAHKASGSLGDAVSLLSQLLKAGGSKELEFTCSQSLCVTVYLVFRLLYRQNRHNSDAIFSLSYEKAFEIGKGFLPAAVYEEITLCLKRCPINTDALELPVGRNPQIIAFVSEAERILKALG
ncbi:MAG: helix-turn-helix transcriptional regulator [Ruminococcus sp.]|nr:helix-turn-helix transcriptional regulator [Ruminococcus sp.]